MAETIDYAPGTPAWVDLGSPDLEGSKTFYSGLFDWEADTIPVPEAGGYTFFKRGGKVVAGLGPLMNPQQPPAWAMYVATNDADATAQKVREAGGQVVMEPMTIMEAGRMAVFIDPTGAFFSVWQPGQHRGAELVNEPGSFGWNELDTRDLQAARDFYQKVFGWGNKGDSYTEWLLNGRSIAGAMEMDERFPATTPPNWLTYFIVEDADAAVKKTEELGGKVLVPPTEIDEGRFTVLADPQGAVFAAMAARQ